MKFGLRSPIGDKSSKTAQATPLVFVRPHVKRSPMLLRKMIALSCLLSPIKASIAGQQADISTFTKMRFPARFLRTVRGGDRRAPSLGGASSVESGWRIDGNPLRPAPGTGRSTRTASKHIPSRPIVENLDGDEDAAAEASDVANAFLSRGSRNRFVSQVYTILACQLLFTSACILGLRVSPSAARYLVTAGGGWVPMLSLLISSGAFVYAAGNETARRSSPTKWKLLGAFTAGQSLAVSVITLFFDTRTVISSMLTTAFAAGTVSAYTIANKNSKRDLTQWGSTLASLSLILLLVGMIQLLKTFGVLPRDFLPITEAMYCAGGATLFSAYLAHHTRLVVSGKHSKYRLHEKDYVLGAMLIYHDIINMFIYILRLLGENKE